MEDRVSLSEALEIMAGYGPAVWCGVVAAVIVLPVLVAYVVMTAMGFQA